VGAKGKIYIYIYIYIEREREREREEISIFSRKALNDDTTWKTLA
jgi:hypothetical protein